MKDTIQVIEHTQKWIVDVVIGCTFCPFAAKEVKRQTITYQVLHDASVKICLQELITSFQKLEHESAIETLFIILPDNFDSFAKYLELVSLSEELLRDQQYEGIYQIASFHPAYLFAGATLDDPANFTNRSPYPMLHILRESSVTRAVESYPDSEKIPERNIAFARTKGLQYMLTLQRNSISGASNG